MPPRTTRVRSGDDPSPAEDNDPALVPVDLDIVQYVYARKQAYGTGGDDDAWRLASVIVLLYDEDTLPLTRSRQFALFARRGMSFGNEHGHQAWLSESRLPGVHDFLNRIAAKAAQASA